MTDSRELTRHGPSGGAIERAGGSARQEVGIPIEQRMAMLREALTNPAVDPQKAVAMAELMFKLEDRDRQAEFNRDLIAAKQEIPPIFKRGHNTHQNTKYGKHEDIQRVVDPILARHGLSIDYKIGSEGPMLTVRPVLRHVNGWVEVGEAIKGPPDEGPGRSKIQSVGSSASYLQRYAAKAALNLRFDGEDDDGVGGRLNDVPNDRQEQLVLDAQEAAARGEYDGWYERLNRKDKAWLVTAGHHARIGGGRALPGPELRQEAETGSPAREEPRRAEPERKEPVADDSATGARAKPQITPEQWVDRYCGDIDKIVNVDRLDEYLDGKREALGRLEKSHPALYKRANDHSRERREAIEEGRLM